jgi:hypothetical protein
VREDVEIYQVWVKSTLIWRVDVEQNINVMSHKPNVLMFYVEV